MAAVTTLRYMTSFLPHVDLLNDAVAMASTRIRVSPKSPPTPTHQHPWVKLLGRDDRGDGGDERAGIRENSDVH